MEGVVKLQGPEASASSSAGSGGFGTSGTTGGGNEGTQKVAAKRSRVCGEEVIQRRLVGADGQSMLDIMRMVFSRMWRRARC